MIDNGATGFKFENINDIMFALNTIINNSEKTHEIIKEARNVAQLKFSESTYVVNVYNYVINNG